ncbi:phosphoribosyltransferase family protein [Candidatus Hodarchaeum mangrovi]
MVVKFLTSLFEEYNNLETMASILNNYIIGKFQDTLDKRQVLKGIFSVADLSRYINRKALPTDERKNFLLSFILDKIVPANLIVKGILGMRIQDVYFVDTSALLSDLDLLKKIAFIVARTELFDKKFDKIVAGSTDGTPFALILAQEFEIPLVYIKHDPPLGIEEYLSKSIQLYEQNRQQTIYLQRAKINPKDRVLIIDDIIRTGKTVQTLLDMVEECKAEVSAIISIIGISKDYKVQSSSAKSTPEIITLYNIA